MHAQARKDDAERKRLEALQKKKERDEMMAAEDAQVQATTKKAAGPQPKLTRAQIRAEAERRAAAAMAAVQNKQKAAQSARWSDLRFLIKAATAVLSSPPKYLPTPLCLRVFFVCYIPNQSIFSPIVPL